MSTRISFWLETRRALAQWIGIVLASIVSGILLGVLRRQGLTYRLSLEIAVPVGLLCALLFWVWLTRRFVAKNVEISVPVSINAVTLEGDFTVVYCYSQALTEPAIACQNTAV
jgi:hypothetical protein